MQTDSYEHCLETQRVTSLVIEINKARTRETESIEKFISIEGKLSIIGFGIEGQICARISFFFLSIVHKTLYEISRIESHLTGNGKGERTDSSRNLGLPIVFAHG